MSVKVILPPVLQVLVGNIDQIDVTGRTVGECLETMVQRYPQLKPKLFNRNKKLPNGINIFVNGESAYPEPLAKAVHDGDKIYVSYIVLGG